MGSCPRVEPLPGELFPVGSCPRIIAWGIVPVGVVLEPLLGNCPQWGVVLEPLPGVLSPVGSCPRITAWGIVPSGGVVLE